MGIHGKDLVKFAEQGNVRGLIESAEECDLAEFRWKDGRSLLHLASAAGQLQSCRALIQIGVDINARERQHLRTPLYECAAAGHNDVVKELLQSGAKVNLTKSGGWTALMVAASKGFPDVVESLISHRARLDLFNSEGLGGSIASFSKTETNDLLHHRPRFVLHLHLGASALHLAARNGNEHVVRLILDHDASHRLVMSVNRVGKTPLFHACYRGNMKAVEVLIDSGSELTHRDSGQSTILHEACSQGQSEVLELLLTKARQMELTSELTSAQDAIGKMCIRSSYQRKVVVREQIVFPSMSSFR
uniref:Uncharacterized protein n=2 Tax=Rhodosorus marinus TaxID=101924 RepID=A0A7S2ZTG1_9RHOD|mmetsp:Transcript_30142/g.115653  ORF Transcript_30142/g.115653 Transcript_30142/m.115653 type:complete len:304 (+) Transcript_30142:221-1132(+)